MCEKKAESKQSQGSENGIQNTKISKERRVRMRRRS
jgi:hypothetical protein